MDDERAVDDEEQERPRPRVVDKRVSARPAGGAPPSPAAAERASTEEASQEPSEPSGAGPIPSEDEVHPPGEQPSGQVWTPQQEEQARRIAEELARTPGPDLVVTFAMNFVEVASVKLEAGDLAGAQLAIDAFDGILSAVGSRLGEAERPMRGVLAQLQMAFTQTAAAPPSTS